MQIFFLQRFYIFMRTRFDMGFHVLDLLIQFVVFVKQVNEMAVSRLEAGDQITVFGKHANSGNS
jgi:hypothetical protein